MALNDLKNYIRESNKPKEQSDIASRMTTASGRTAPPQISYTDGRTGKNVTAVLDTSTGRYVNLKAMRGVTEPEYKRSTEVFQRERGEFESSSDYKAAMAKASDLSSAQAAKLDQQRRRSEQIRSNPTGVINSLSTDYNNVVDAYNEGRMDEAFAAERMQTLGRQSRDIAAQMRMNGINESQNQDTFNYLRGISRDATAFHNAVNNPASDKPADTNSVAPVYAMLSTLSSEDEINEYLNSIGASALASDRKELSELVEHNRGQSRTVQQINIMNSAMSDDYKIQAIAAYDPALAQKLYDMSEDERKEEYRRQYQYGLMSLDEYEEALAKAEQNFYSYYTDHYDPSDPASVAEYEKLNAEHTWLLDNKDKAWTRSNDLKYSAVTKNEDFAKKSATDYSNRDPMYMYINNIGGVQDKEENKDVYLRYGEGAASSPNPSAGLYEKYKNMTDEEVAMYNYLYKTKGKEAAEEYLTFAEYAINARNLEQTREEATDAANKNLFGASLDSVGKSTISGIGFLDAAVQKAGQVTSELFGGGIAAPVDYNTAAMQPSVYASTVLQVGAENLNKKYGMISSNEEDRGKPGVFFIDEKKNPLMARILNGKGWGDVYQSGMSQLNSWVGAGLSFLVPGLGLITLASSAATNEMLNTVEKGGSDTQALAMGFFAGFAEYIMEKFPMDNLLHGDWTGNKLGSFIRQTLPEGLEEGGTSIINWVADAIIMARDSDYSQKADAYIANGMDEKTAKQRAFWDKVIEIGWDVAGGIAMGSTTGAARAGIQTVVDAKNIGTLKKSASIDTYRAITPDLVTRVLAETPNDKTALSIRAQMNEGGVESVKANDIYRLILKNGDTVKQMLSSAAQVINESAAIVEKAEAMPVSVTRSAIDQVKAGTATNKTFEKILDAAKTDPAIQAELKSLGVDITAAGGMTTAQKRKAVKTAIDAQESESEAKAAAEAKAKADIAAEAIVQAPAVQTETEPAAANAIPTENASATAPVSTESPYSQSTQLAINAQRAGDSNRVGAFISQAVKSPAIMAELGVQSTGNNQKDRTAIKKRITELAAMPATSAPTTTASATTAKAAPARSASSSASALESYAQFAENYRKENPNATEAQIRAAYERKASSVARAGKTIRTGHGEMSFDQYREVMIADARAKGDTISEGDIMSWFDTRKAKQDSIRSKREPVLGAAVDHVNEAFKKHGFKYTVRLSFDAADFPATKTQENAFVNYNTGEIVMNGWVITSEEILLKRLTHEIVHPGSKADTTLVNEIIDTFDELNAAGKLDGTAKRLVDNKDTAIKNRMDLYQRHENELATKEGREARTISEANAREEYAADLMGEMFGATKLAQEVASYKPSLVARIQKALRKVIKAFDKEDDKNPIDAEVVAKIQALEEKITKALQDKAKDSEGEAIVNHSISSMAEAAGLQAVRDETSGRITFVYDGMAVDKVTAEHIKSESGLGVLIGTAVENGFISGKDASIQYNSAAEIMNMIMTTQDPDMVWQFVGASMFSAVKSSADGQYGTTVDFSTICRKTQDMITAMSHAMKKLGRGLTKDEVTQLQKKLIEEGTLVPCPVCYVFSRWAGIGAVLDKMALWQDKYADYDKQALADRIAELEKRSKAADLRKALKAEDDEYQKLNSEHEKLSRKLTGLRKQLKASKGEEAASVKGQIEIATRQRKYIKDQMNDIEDKARGELAWLKTVRTQDGYKAVPKDILYDLENAEAFASDEYALSWKYRTTRGPSAGKAILPYADMRLGDMILGVGKTSADGNDTFKVTKGELNDDQRKAVVKAIARTRAQNLIGGQRFQSTSDFRYDYALDYVLAFWEAQALGSNIQTYTKVIEFADMIAAIGGDVNLSVMPKDKGYKDGKLIFSNVTGINYEAALEAHAKYDNAQLILVGINDEHIRLALEDNGETGGETIGFVIPYHASGASIEEFISALVSNLNEQFVKDNYVDYSDVQGDKARSNATEVQTRRRDLRKQILTGKHKAENEEGKTTSQSWTPTEADFELLIGESVDISNRSFEDLRAVEKKALAGDAEAIREYESWSAGVLKDLFNKLWDSNGSQYGVRLNSTQAASIMPHEYWNTNTTRTNAYVNGFIFRSYCYNLGLHPRFTGINSKGKTVDHGNFADSTGYWKTLIDRPMYRNDGTYRDQQAVNMSNFQKGMLTKEWAETHWGEFKVKEPNVSKATQAADKFVAEVSERSHSLSATEPGENYLGLNNQERIVYGMTDEERASILEAKSIVAEVYNGQADRLIAERTGDLQSNRDSLVKTALIKIAEEFNVFTDYRVEDVDVDIRFSRGNLKESVSKKINPMQIAKLMPVLRQAIEGSVGIECHDNRYFYDNDTVMFENLLGGYIDDGSFVPIRFGLKHSVNGKATLYLVVDQNKIDLQKIKKAEVAKTTTQKMRTKVSRSAFNINIASIASLVNSKDLLRYLPDEMLNEEQIAAKWEAISETILYTNKKNDKKYREFVQNRNLYAAKGMVFNAAKSAGYKTKAYHGTVAADPFYVFKNPYHDIGYHVGSKAQALARINGSTTGRVMELFVKLDKPVYVPGDPGDWRGLYLAEYMLEVECFEDDPITENGIRMLLADEDLKINKSEEYQTERLREYLMYRGYDGIQYDNRYEAYGESSVEDPEWKYDSDTSFIVFDPSQLKSADTITYDNDGNIVPISERFNSENNDIRYSLSDPETLESEFNIEDRDILANLNADRFTGVPKNILKNYQKVYGEWEAASSELFTLLSNKATPEEIAKAKKEVAELDDRLTKIEEQKAVQSILENERAYIEQRTTLEASQIAPEENRYNAEFESDITSNNAIRRDRLAEYYEMVSKYGAISKGESPARDVSVPRATADDNRVSQTVRTALEAKITDLDTSVALQEAVQKGGFSYIPITDKDALEVAKKNLSGKTWGEAMNDWKEKVGSGHFGKYDVAEGFYLYNTAIQNGDTQSAVDILTDLSARVREGAQMVQAVRILKKMSPDNRMYALTRSVRQLQEQINKQHGSKAPEIKLDQNLLDAYLNAETDEELDSAKANLYQSIAVQVPRTFMDKWNAWRYLSMLGNPKTILRNTLGNALFMPVVEAKNAVAAGLEKAFVKDRSQRTKSLAVSGRENLRKTALDDYKLVESAIQGNGKYIDQANVSDELAEAIREAKSTFKAWGIRHWQQATNYLMNDSVIGDYGFLRAHYSHAFASACLARGISAEDIANGTVSQDQLDSIRAYAIKEAQKATFRDANAFSNIVKKLRVKGYGTGAKVFNALLEGVQPFKSTPANVLVRAVEYSPLGLIKTLAVDSFRLKNGDITAAEYIDNISSGLTGSMLTAVGWVLGSMGVLITDVDDDEERMGRQPYAIQLFGKSYTLDWLAPEAVPLFLGTAIANITERDKDVSVLEAFFDSMADMIQPMLELSMLSGVQDMLDTMLYGEDGVDMGSIVYGLLVTPAINYVSQGIPTILSQLANTFEMTSGYTYTGDLGTQASKKFTRSIIKVLEKIPFVDIRQADYIDEWGRTEDKGGFLTRLINSFFNPGYSSDIVVTEADVELERLEEMTGTNVAPSRRGYTITVPSEDGTSSTKVKLDVEQYEAYSREYGTQAAMMMAALMSSDVYADMSDADRVKALQTVNQLADEFGKLAAGVGYQVKVGDSEKKLVDLTQTGLSIAEAYTSKLYHAKLDEDRDLKLNEKAALYLEWVEGQDWTSEQKAATLNAYGQFWSVVGSDTEKYQTFTSTTGLSSDDYLALNDAKETYADGAWSQAELTSYLSRTSYTMSQKAAIFDMTFPNAKNNPYK